MAPASSSEAWPETKTKLPAQSAGENICEVLATSAAITSICTKPPVICEIRRWSSRLTGLPLSLRRQPKLPSKQGFCNQQKRIHLAEADKEDAKQMMGLETHDLLHGKCERPFAPVRARSVKPPVCRALIQVSEPERTPNLAIFPTDSGGEPDSAVWAPAL